MENFDRSSHGTDHPAANNALGELEMMETKQVHALIEIKHAFGHIVKAEEFIVTAIKFDH